MVAFVGLGLGGVLLLWLRWMVVVEVVVVVWPCRVVLDLDWWVLEELLLGMKMTVMRMMILTLPSWHCDCCLWIL